MGTDGETHTSYVQLQECAGGYSLGNNGLTPKKKRGVSGNWSSRGFLKGAISTGELSFERSVVLHDTLYGFS